MNLIKVVTHCLLGIVLGQDWGFNYANQGKDWNLATPPDGWSGNNRCGEEEN